MVLRHLPLLALLVAGATSLIHCPRKDSCFAESPDCDPNEDCETVLRFDDNGNMDLFVRNITATDYVSIIADRDLFNTIEYFICVPFSGQRLRAMGRAGQIALFTQQNLTNVVERLGSNFFQCIFNAHELSRDFRQNREFIVSRGEFQQFLSVNEGFKLHRLEMEQNKDVDEDLEADSILPNIYKVRASTHARESVFSTDENKMASGVVHKMDKMQKMYTDSDGIGLDELVTKKTPIAEIHANIKHLDNGVNRYDDVDDAHSNLDSDNEDDGDVHSRRHRTQSKARATRYDNNDEDEKDETGMRALKRSSNGHSTSRRRHYKEDDIESQLDTDKYLKKRSDQKSSRSNSEETGHVPQREKTVGGSNKNKNEDDSNSPDDDDYDEAVLVMMTKREMYTLLNKQAGQKVSEPKKVTAKHNNSYKGSSITIALIITFIFAF